MKILWNFTLKQRVKHKLCKVWLCLQFSWGNHLLYEKSIRSFMIECLYDNLLIYHSCLPVFPDHFWVMTKTTFQVVLTGFQRKSHMCFCAHTHRHKEHNLWKQSSPASSVALRKNQIHLSIHSSSSSTSHWRLRLNTAWATCNFEQERNKKWCKPISLDRRDTDGDDVWTTLSASRSSLKPLAIIMMKKELFISPQFSDVAKAILHWRPEFSYKRLCCPW